jgi:FkbH-like protein
LDNTLWGGAVRSDGLEGIRLGRGSSVGEAFVALQVYLEELRRRGVILAVCATSEEEDAMLPFREHPEMVLKEHHVTAVVADWGDKASQIREVAAQLNVAVDSTVFLHGDPAVRRSVREQIPEIAVPELTADPADHVRLLSSAGYFEAISFRLEDRNGAYSYGANATLAPWRFEADSDQYLASLQMIATLSGFSPLARSRVVQLMNRSTRFNLTARRYTESAIAQIERMPRKFCLQVSLADRFGDNGIVSVAIFDRSPKEWRCDTWLMNCNFVGRRIEELVLATVAEAARAEGATRLIGVYIPTRNNNLVADHFSNMGFERLSSLPNGASEWVLDLDLHTPPILPITVVRANGLTRHATAN